MANPKQNPWYVLTGGPCSGKTTLLHELALRGYATVEESGRDVLESAVDLGFNQRDLKANIDMLQKSMFWVSAISSGRQDPKRETFFDECLVDNVGYSKYWAVDMGIVIDRLKGNLPYSIYFALDKIADYKNDEIRTQDVKQSELMRKAIQETYIEMGIVTVKVPVMPVTKRADFILDQIGG